MTETTTAENNALVSLNLNLPAPTVVAEQVNKAFHTIYGKIEEEIAAFVPDVTTEKGRQAIASLAYKIARTKTGLDDAAANVTADQKAIIDAVNKERKQMREDLDTLKAKVRAPLDAWEVAEKAKRERADVELHRLACLRVDCAGLTSAELRVVLGNMKAMDAPAKPEFGEAAEQVLWERQSGAEALERWISEAEKREAEAAELEQLRREKAEREAKEAAEREEEEARKREEEERDRIAKEAAEKAEREAQEKIEAERREYEAKIAEAERRVKEEEEARHNAEVQRKREAEEAKRREEENARLSEQFAQEAARRAAEAERQRIESERLAQEEAEAQRTADLEHRKRINVAAANAMIKAGEITEQQAKAIVAAIFKGQVPNVAISY